MNINPSILSELATSFTKEEIENQNRILGATSDNNQEIIEEEKKEKIMEKYNIEFKERLLMEYTMLIEKICDLQHYLDHYNDGSDMTKDQNGYLQLMLKQMEAMCMYRESLYERIMMIMEGVIK